MADRDILPDHFKPANYELRIKDLDFKNWSYQGRVEITGELRRPTSAIVLNTLQLKLQQASFVSHDEGGQSWNSTDFLDDAKSQRTTIRFPRELPTSDKATLSIEFAGDLNHELAGFYRSQYKPASPAAASIPRDEQFHYMLSTQFESCDARRAFPCFDEPNLKATFDVALEIPEDQVALSNMPVKDEQVVGSGKKLVRFERSPIMSTYLLAWAVGDFEYVEAFTAREYGGKQLPVRVYTTRGLKEQGRWALEHAPKIIDFFSDRFGIDYPLPKSDILAVHEFTHGAMENWGLVTYRMTAILFDEKLSETRFRNRIAYVVAHELAHQWFGNLVTMDWWDELWLNEGFATWAGWLATHHLHSEWDVWPRFVTGDMAQAFALDSIRASHPIQVPVRDALDVNQIFDKISYLKGCSMIRMLAAKLGVQTFLEGITIYLKRHSYGNAKTRALWDALSEASGVDVNAIMSAWIEKIGFPVLTVTEGAEGAEGSDGAEGTQKITVRQSRFLSTGDVRPEDDETTWWVPLGFRGTVDVHDDGTLDLTAREFTIDGVSKKFYLLNGGASGFYRVNYPASRLKTLGTQLHRLSVEDKIFVIGSAADLAFAGHGTTAGLLSFVEGLQTETHDCVLSEMLDDLDEIKSVFGDDDQIKRGLETLTLRLIGGALEQVGWEARQGETFGTTLLRKRLLLVAIASGHQETIDKAYRLFSDYVADAKAHAIPADLRAPAYRAAIRKDPAKTVAALKKEWFSTAAIDGKEICLGAMGHVQDPALVVDVLLPFLFGMAPPAPAHDAVPAGDMHILTAALSSNRTARGPLWAYVRDNWAGVRAKLGGNPILLDRVVALGLAKFADTDTLADIDAFFATVSTKGFDRSLETVKDKIRARAAYRQRDGDGLKAWLVERGYV